MAYTKRTTLRRRGSKAKYRSKTQTRKAGAFGLYRSTRFQPLRTTARVLANPVRISRGLTPFPNTKIVRHKYVENIQFPGGSSAGTPATYQYRANSMYDPNYTGVGHQPLFRDQMAAQYNYYTVISSYFKITFPPESNEKRTFSVWVDEDGVTPTTDDQMNENHRFYPGLILSRRNSPLKLTARFNSLKWNKNTLGALMADNNQKIASSSNPGSTAVKYYNVMCWPTNAADTLGAITATVEMFFITIWREPVEHATS